LESALQIDGEFLESQVYSFSSGNSIDEIPKILVKLP
jgi:hypothetical protein